MVICIKCAEWVHEKRAFYLSIVGVFYFWSQQICLEDFILVHITQIPNAATILLYMKLKWHFVNIQRNIWLCGILKLLWEWWIFSGLYKKKVSLGRWCCGWHYIWTLQNWRLLLISFKEKKLHADFDHISQFVERLWKLVRYLQV
jgi:hypothetical protein